MRRRSLAGAVAVLAASVGIGTLAPSADAAPTVGIKVDAGTSLGTVPSSGAGLNTGVGDDRMGTAKVTSLMKAAGVRQLRYPGGSGADDFHWKTHTMGNGGWIVPNTDFDSFMATAKKVGAQPILTANYGSGTPKEAADWVKYANVDKGYGVKYWEIGNEVYGNGHYANGKGWETDNHADKSPKEYGKNLVAYAKAMKAVDPTVKIGAVLTTPGGWPDKEKAPGDSADWNNTVLSIAGSSIDFVIVHWYPGGKTAADLLNTPSRIAGVTSELRSLIAKYTGSRAASVEIAVTETDAEFSPVKTSQAAALFAPDTYMTWFEQGATHVDWWNLHNGSGDAPTTVNGETDYQDGGILSAGTCAGGKCQPPRDTPFPTYWGIRSLTALAQPGDTMVKSSSRNTSVAVHAVRSSKGGLNVMLINKSPKNAAQVSLSYAGFTPAAGAVTTVSYGKGDTALTTAKRGTAGAQTLPPYSITTLQLKPASGTASADKPSPAHTPPAAAPLVSAAGTTGSRAQAENGAPVGRPSPSSSSNTFGPLASTGASTAVTYSAIGGLLVVAAGGVLVLRGRRRRALHGK
ncbi:LPXTG cell wall anchor domain-containing protein [Streptomyces europaeiscabiei]|uniref:LPXTG cell wall anchor domain-containing protein n=1 Tax=Streptomyces europaeiscabiei TaxID=146819 RepID=A0ABU4NVH3_9ACTN|nr:LPXTG cell wall anchor domain-containing protein [Streptomyces europaeiscabiei]MDX2530758.1 LPXTG cell wall anchor domain-containing protein [Streptomyces europaeiscabiei]MDX2762161.1 LPXTG cell wall anchor domain-containing protein [Streptomyces europaeiscabiei]MDX2770103.1 LPXTG cell wall anchor domain-containing protein [Streptomyces europaeiscabiei]MDX3548695.1 LPXTG cell wall anchor domain-containing protein [Streptomyces europaeiscabiei]MDX3558108.1 LPXTG cell wall anchor domain-conta